MQLDLTDEETAALTRLLTNTIDADRYPLSPRIQTLKGILGKIRPEPARAAIAAAEALRAAACYSGPKAAIGEI